MSTGVFPGGKGGRCVRLTALPPSCAVVMKSGNLNFREPCGPLQACHGTALFLTYICIYIRVHAQVCVRNAIDNFSWAHLFWVEGRLQRHTDGVAEVSDAEHDERQPLSFREVPHRHCCRFVSSAVALYLPIKCYTNTTDPSCYVLFVW